MDERILKWLYDIKSAIDEIESYFIDTPDDFEYYKSNLILKHAVERNLEIIGEAVNRILNQEPDFALIMRERSLGLEIKSSMLMIISQTKIFGQ